MPWPEGAQPDDRAATRLDARPTALPSKEPAKENER